mmetsp:Transcript_29663/g.41343  ORF Transcript_29663/g.41343 Transcript_29663/m.41343 type:complete len:211 (-) Transcript_29663:218-850(-)
MYEVCILDTFFRTFLRHFDLDRNMAITHRHLHILSINLLASIAARMLNLRPFASPNRRTMSFFHLPNSLAAPGNFIFLRCRTLWNAHAPQNCSSSLVTEHREGCDKLAPLGRENGLLSSSKPRFPLIRGSNTVLIRCMRCWTALLAILTANEGLRAIFAAFVYTIILIAEGYDYGMFSAVRLHGDSLHTLTEYQQKHTSGRRSAPRSPSS